MHKEHEMEITVPDNYYENELERIREENYDD